MSRPFSYNDENFTVIGNILFLHSKVTREYKKGSNIIEIPQAIYDRMYNKSNQVQITSFKDSDPSDFWVDCGTRKYTDGKYYLYAGNRDIVDYYVGFYMLSWYFLKDI